MAGCYGAALNCELQQTGNQYGQALLHLFHAAPVLLSQSHTAALGSCRPQNLSCDFGRRDAEPLATTRPKVGPTTRAANTVTWETDRSAPAAEAKSAAKATEGRYSEPVSIVVAIG